MQGNYSIFIRSKNGTLIDRVNEYVDLHMLMTLNDPGSWSLSSVSHESCPFSAGNGIIVPRNGKFLYGGIMTEISDVFDATTGLHKWQVNGKGDLEYLNRRICYVAPTTGSTTTTAYYTDSGFLNDVVRKLIWLNLGTDGLADRREPIVENYQQDTIYQSVSVKLRFQNLLDAVTATVSGEGYNIRANWDTENMKVYYEIFHGRDLTTQVVFTEQLNNISSAERVINAPEGNFILAGGTGELTERSFATAKNENSISDWGRIEVFQDARNQHSVSTYVPQVLENKTKNTVGYRCTASNDDCTPQFGADYELGDFIGMKVFGQFVTAEVQQVEIDLSDGLETIEPSFGTVAIGKLNNIFRQLKNLRTDVDELLGTEVE